MQTADGYRLQSINYTNRFGDFKRHMVDMITPCQV